MVVYWTTMALTGNRELGFDSGEGAWETATTSRASLVPAAAVIPALIAYIKVAAVKKLVVGFQGLHIPMECVPY